MRVYGIPGSCSLRVVSLMLVSAALVWGPDISLAQVPVELGARGAGAPGLSQTSTPGGRNIPGRYIVKFVAGTVPSARAAAAQQIGAAVVHNFAFSDSIAIAVPNENALNGLRNSRSVWQISPDQFVELAAKPPAVPRSPNNLVATVSSSDVTLTWNDRASNEQGFKVQRCTGSGCASFSDLTAGLPPNAQSFNDPDLADGTFRYRVIAFNAAGDSDPSNIAEVTVSAGGPPPPPPPPPPPDPAVRGTRQVLTYAVQRVGRPVEGSTGLGIGVAVVDTGIDFLHADLTPAPDAPGSVDPNTGTATGTSFNALAPGTSCQDTFSHGTHLAGLISARDNNIGIVGVAPEATLFCVKVGATDDGLIALSDLQAGLEWVLASHARVSPPIRVVNLSLATPGGSVVDPARAEIDNLIQQLYAQGVAVVAAAGNDPTADVSQMFPASVAHVISVGGTTAANGINTCPLVSPWVFADTAYGGAGQGTTDGVGVTISAPAEERADIVASSTGCTLFFYGTLSTSLTTVDGTPGTDDLISRKLPAPLGPVEARGTSYATALVSGVVARILQAELEAGSLFGTSGDVDGTRTTLVSTADRVGEAPLDHPWSGIGLVVYDFDGIREGIAQAPMPAPTP